LVQVVDAIGVQERGPALDAVHGVALVEQEFGEVGAVLPGNARDEGDVPLCHAAPLPQSFLGSGREYRRASLPVRPAQVFALLDSPIVRAGCRRSAPVSQSGDTLAASSRGEGRPFMFAKPIELEQKQALATADVVSLPSASRHEVEVQTSLGEFCALAHDWDAVGAAASARSVFNNWMWHFAWWDEHRQKRALRLLVARRAGA